MFIMTHPHDKWMSHVNTSIFITIFIYLFESCECVLIYQDTYLSHVNVSHDSNNK